MFVWLLEGVVLDVTSVRRHLDRWTGRFGSTPGYLGAIGGITDDRVLMLFVIWESEDAGNRLLADPEPHEWYDEFQQCFEGGLITFTESAEVVARLPSRMHEVGFVTG